MASKTRNLATYIERIHYGDDFDPFRGKIFDYGIAHRSPYLEFGRMNRILVYPGSFNPPHRGHFELLRHGFGQSGRDMNIIAAIVLPLDDDSLMRKLGGQKDPLIFNKAERVRLWKGYVPSAWYWIYDRSVNEWDDFQKRLTQAITEDGFELSWVGLCGPDYVKVNEVPSIPTWGCRDLIVSDVGRPADFIFPTMNKLKVLDGCGAWEKITSDVEAVQKYARESTNWVISGMFIISIKAAQSGLNKGKIRFSMASKE